MPGDGVYNPPPPEEAVPDAIVCLTCKRPESETQLHKCPICFKYVCGEHAFNYSGRIFCDKHCADYFFFADED